MTATALDPGDGSGDVIIELPPKLLSEMGLTVGDLLTIELIDGAIVLKPVRQSASQTTPEAGGP
ncbi:AbrB/MazE/SpoVT family DNA-binding domain-containing protein [Pseudomonas sp. S32]|uniref:AbrB/MazE/SpoVT family DNA-binding domain-containing protein n=1 Tax=Pseudomonas sp. S32 TaxID=2767448 RepID=UPI003FA6992F